MFVQSARDSLIPFVIASLLLHLSLLVSWPRSKQQPWSAPTIPVSLLPPVEDRPTPIPPPGIVGKTATATPGRIATRPSKAPAQLATKSSPILEEAAKAAPRPPAAQEKPTQETAENLLPLAERTIARRPLPTLKELLPPVTVSPAEGDSGDSEGPIRLETREPKYISYFDSIKRAIELIWQYPAAARRQGIQGKLLLEFSILADGTLARTRLLQSSGFIMLDEEALRAVRGAAPFQPIPPWIGRNRIDIVASFEYHDDRVRYGVVP